MINDFMARYISGDVTYADYTPSGAEILAGDVIVLGATVAIAHVPIADGDLGALAIAGGIYEAMSDAAVTLGSLVYWNAVAETVTAVGTDTFLGVCTKAVAGAGLVEFFHMPAGS